MRYKTYINVIILIITAVIIIVCLTRSENNDLLWWNGSLCAYCAVKIICETVIQCCHMTSTNIRAQMYFSAYTKAFIYMWSVYGYVMSEKSVYQRSIMTLYTYIMSLIIIIILSMLAISNCALYTFISCARPREINYATGLLTTVMVTKKAENPDTCSICLDDWERDEYIVELECKHKYHKLCIEKWAAVKNNCPQCRGKIQQV